MSAVKKKQTGQERKKTTDYDSAWKDVEEYKMPYVTSWERIAEKRGEKRGEEKGKLETARELIKNGVDINIISKSTGFSLQEIEKLAETVQ